MTAVCQIGLRRGFARRRNWRLTTARPVAIRSLAAEEQHHGSIAWRRQTDFDRCAIVTTGRGSAELRGDRFLIFRVQEPDQFTTEQCVGGGVEQLAKRAVCFGEAAEAIDDRNPDRGIGKETLVRVELNIVTVSRGRRRQLERYRRRPGDRVDRADRPQMKLSAPNAGLNRNLEQLGRAPTRRL